MTASDYRWSLVQRNQLCEDAVSLGLDASEFEWIDDTAGYYDKVHKLVHPPTGGFLKTIIFTQSSGGQYCSFDYFPRSAELDQHIPFEWYRVRAEIRKWLATIKREVDAPDLWRLARQERAWVTSKVSPDNNTPFSRPEIDQIRAHLQTIEAYAAKTYRLTAQQHEEVRERLAYLTDAAERVGRFDWKNLVWSTFTQIVLQVGLPPDRAQDLLNFTTQLLGPFVTGAVRLLGGA